MRRWGTVQEKFISEKTSEEKQRRGKKRTVLLTRLVFESLDNRKLARVVDVLFTSQCMISLEPTSGGKCAKCSSPGERANQ